MSSENKDPLIYRIVFPLDATPEEKILISAAAMTIDNFVYERIGKLEK